MNVARGYLRLSIAIIGSWVAVWSAIGTFAVWQQGIYSRIFVDERRSGTPIEDLSFTSLQASHYGELVGTSLMWGLLCVPMALALALGWWVYRGFIPRHT
jgi:hypothetical protein